MTAQVREILFYKGEEYHMASEPLETYLKMHNISFLIASTGCWRGYVGTWSIEDDKLLLVELTNGSGKDMDFKTLLPDRYTKVFAEWFSGELRVPYGEELEYIHQGYASIYEKELFLTIKNGVLIGETEKDNRDRYENPTSKKEMRDNALLGAIFGVISEDDPKPKKSFWKKLVGK